MSTEEELFVYNRKTLVRFKFGQLSVPEVEEKRFIDECDSVLTSLNKKELTTKLKEIISRYSFGDITARSLLKIHGRNYKPSPKIRVKKGQARYSQEEKQLYIDNFKEHGWGPTKLHSLELLKEKNKPNPSVATISVWIRRAERSYIKKSGIPKLQLDVVKQLASFKTVAEISDILKSLDFKPPSRKTIENIIEMEGISVKQGKTFDEKVYICEIAQSHGIPKAVGLLASEGIKTSETRIRAYFKELKIDLPDVSDSYRKYELIHHDFFDVIDTENKAYWLGFIAADGAVRYGKLLEIELQRSDKDHLKKFTKDLGTDKQIYLTEKFSKKYLKVYEAAKIVIFSKQLVTSLEKYGIIQNKTNDLDINTKLIPSNLHRHFWRGYFDGDGTLSKEASIQVNTLDFSGTLKIVEKAYSFIKEKTDLELEGPYLHGIWRIRCQSKNIADILYILYADSSVYLDRKQKLANRKMLRINNKSQ